jgi:hypothetical protein
MGLQTFKGYLAERFVNAINDDPKKEEYVDQVWNIIQKAYEPIGGIKTNGFQTKEKMMTLPFWKMAVQDGKVVAVVIYKDKNGRKSVAMATDGSEIGKKRIVDMVKNDLKRSYGEKSKAALGTLMKTVPEDIIKQFLITPKEVERITGDEIIPLKGYKGEVPKDAQVTLQKYPYLKDYGYLKDFGGSMLFKVMFGTPGKGIK